MTDLSYEYEDRRRHMRVALGMPVRVHFAGQARPVTVEMRDVSHGGCYFRGVAAPRSARLAFGFVLPERQMCVARGRVLRVDNNGFAVEIERSNETFANFLTHLSGPVKTAHAA